MLNIMTRVELMIAALIIAYQRYPEQYNSTIGNRLAIDIGLYTPDYPLTEAHKDAIYSAAKSYPQLCLNCFHPTGLQSLELMIGCKECGLPDAEGKHWSFKRYTLLQFEGPERIVLHQLIYQTLKRLSHG